MLDIGDNIRYTKIGAGTVISHVERDFQGQARVFAVIDFPHKNMSVQLPIGDPVVKSKIEKVYSKTKILKNMNKLDSLADHLPRTWDVREQIGDSVLESNDPKEWFKLLASYAYAEGSGVSIAASDKDIVRGLKELIAAELACASKISYQESIKEVEDLYQKAVKKIQKRGKQASSFAAVDL